MPIDPLPQNPFGMLGGFLRTMYLKINEIIAAIGGSSSGLSQYGVYTRSQGDGNLTIAGTGAKVLFHDNAIQTSGLSMVQDSGNIALGAGAGGFYKISFIISTLNACGFAVYVNGVLYNVSLFGSQDGGQVTGSALFSLSDGDVVSLYTESSLDGSVTIAPTGFNSIGGVIASIMLEKLS